MSSQDDEEMIVVMMPAPHWSQIVSDIENMCGTDESEIEILSQYVIVRHGVDLVTGRG